MKEGMRISWKSWVLLAAGVYNLAWGAFFLVFPLEPYRLVGIDALGNPLVLWGAGLGVSVLGIGYLVAAYNPLRFWPIILVGLASKVASPVGFLYLASKNPDLWSISWAVVVNDLIWWGPFVLMLLSAYRRLNSHSQAPLTPSGARVGE